MNDTDIHAAGQLLYRQHRRDEVFSLMTSTLAPETLDEAYDIQDVYTSLLAGDDPKNQGAFAGYKIAYTSPVMQQRLGTTEPAFGRLLSREVLGSPATVNAASYQGLEVECEVAVRLYNDLPGGGHSEKEVFDVVGEIMIAFEIVNRRQFEGRPSLVQSVAMNVINAGAVTGNPVREWQSLDLGGSRAVLQINGAEVAQAMGKDVAGHPLRPLVWLAGALGRRDRSLKKGDLVITGSMTPPMPVVAGDVVVLEMEHLGSVELRVEP